MTINFAYKKTNKISLFSVVTLLFFVDFVTIEYIDSPIYTLIQYIILIPVLLYCLANSKCVEKKQCWFMATLVLMLLCIIFSTVHNQAVGYYIRASIFYGLLIFIMCYLLEIAQYKNRIEEFLNVGKKYLTMIITINDCLMLALPSKFYNISGHDIGTCLLGNKFVVSYWHLMLVFLAILLEKNEKKQKKKVIIYVFLLSCICVYIDCTTALLASWVLIILYFLPQNIKKILSNTIVYMLSFLISAFLLLMFDGILLWKPIQYLVVNILHRDATLTGRLQVYTYIFKLFLTHKWLGYGYGTDIVQKTSIWYANVQNGFWDFVIRYGLLTMLFLALYMLFAVIRHAKLFHEKKSDKSNWLCFAMLYLYLFMGISEIVYSKLFLFYITLVAVICSENFTTRKGKNSERKSVDICDCTNLQRGKVSR